MKGSFINILNNPRGLKPSVSIFFFPLLYQATLASQKKAEAKNRGKDSRVNVSRRGFCDSAVFLPLSPLCPVWGVPSPPLLTSSLPSLISLPKLRPYPLCSDERAEAQGGTETQHQGDLGCILVLLTAPPTWSLHRPHTHHGCQKHLTCLQGLL